MKRISEFTKENGVMVGGMGLAGPNLPMEILTKENTDSINDTDRASILGPMDGRTTVNSAKIGGMEEASLCGPMGLSMYVLSSSASIMHFHFFWGYCTYEFCYLFYFQKNVLQEGEFANGQREGNGSYKFSDGGQYDGSWKDGRYSGYGVCSWEDGRCYRGEWRNGMAHGKGIETYADKTVRHDGQWVDDEPVR